MPNPKWHQWISYGSALITTIAAGVVFVYEQRLTALENGQAEATSDRYYQWEHDIYAVEMERRFAVVDAGKEILQLQINQLSRDIEQHENRYHIENNGR